MRHGDFESFVTTSIFFKSPQHAAVNPDVESQTSNEHLGTQEAADHDGNQLNEGSGASSSSATSEVRYVNCVCCLIYSV